MTSKNTKIAWWVAIRLPDGTYRDYTVYATTKKEAEALGYVKHKVDRAFG